MLEKIDDINDKSIVFGNLNLFFESKFEAQGGNPVTKAQILSKTNTNKRKFALCDIWWIRNSHTKHYTFHQQHSAGFIQRSLDFFFISGALQKSAFLIDNSPVTFSVSSKSEGTRSKTL